MQTESRRHVIRVSVGFLSPCLCPFTETSLSVTYGKWKFDINYLERRSIYLNVWLLWLDDKQIAERYWCSRSCLSCVFKVFCWLFMFRFCYHLHHVSRGGQRAPGTVTSSTSRQSGSRFDWQWQRKHTHTHAQWFPPYYSRHYLLRNITLYNIHHIAPWRYCRLLKSHNVGQRGTEPSCASLTCHVDPGWAEVQTAVGWVI